MNLHLGDFIVGTGPMTKALIDRSEYPSFPEKVYMNQASIGMLSSTTVAAMTSFIDSTGRFGSLLMSDDEEIEYLGNLRIVGGRLFNCNLTNVAILAGASELLGQLPSLMSPKSGEEILMVDTDFPALTRPWLQFAKTSGSCVQFVKDLPARDLTDTLCERIGPSTSVVAVSHVQYGTGTIIDVPRLTSRAGDVGALVIIDATQSAGAINVDTKLWGADIVVASGYKWLGGHGGVALGYVSDTMLRETPVLPGWMSTEHPFDFDATSVEYAVDARRFLQSTMSYVSVASLSASLNQLLSFSPDVRENHSKTLSRELFNGLNGSGWVAHHPGGSSAASTHIISLSNPKFSAREIYEQLLARGVICSTRNNRLRISVAAFNDSSDISRVIAALCNGQRVGAGG